MPAKRHAILVAVTAALTHSSVAETRLMASGDPTAFPALFIEDNGQEADTESEPGATRYQLGLTIEGYVKGGDGPAALSDLNDLYVFTVQKLLTDSALAALVETIDEGSMRVSTATMSSQRRLGFALDILIGFVANRTSPTA